MSRERPGNAVYVTATKATKHHAPVTESGFVGEAVKTKADAWSAGLNTAATIASGEGFTIRPKGIHEYDEVSTSPAYDISAGSVGASVWIVTTDNSLTLTGPSSGTKLPFGRIVEKVNVRGRGVTAGRVRIDHDQKDTVA